MNDVLFVISGYAVILGGLAMYAVTLARRLRAARNESLRIRRDAEPGSDPGR